MKLPAVTWADLVWHEDNIPRCRFITWLACKVRMRTKDRLLQWRVIADSTSALYGNCVESTDHLFFQYIYTRQVCVVILNRCNEHYRCGTWAEELETACTRFKRSSL